MVQQQAAATTRSLGLLHRLYPGKIQTLHDLLLGMMAGATAPLLAAQQQDKALKKLLSETLAVISDGAPDLPSDLSGRQHSTQPDVLNQAVEALLRAGHATNLLCLGFRKTRGNRASFHVHGLRTMEAFYPNTTANLLRHHAWERLLACIGDAAMLHLLQHASLFQPAPNGSWLQLSGAPAAQVARRQRAVQQQGHPPRNSRAGRANAQAGASAGGLLLGPRQAAGSAPLRPHSAQQGMLQPLLGATAAGQQQIAQPVSLLQAMLDGPETTTPMGSAAADLDTSGVSTSHAPQVPGRPFAQAVPLNEQGGQAVVLYRSLTGDKPVNRLPRPSSWQRRRAAKRRAAELMRPQPACEASPEGQLLPQARPELATVAAMVVEGSRVPDAVVSGAGLRTDAAEIPRLKGPAAQQDMGHSQQMQQLPLQQDLQHPHASAAGRVHDAQAGNAEHCMLHELPHATPAAARNLPAELQHEATKPERQPGRHVELRESQPGPQPAGIQVRAGSQQGQQQQASQSMSDDAKALAELEAFCQVLDLENSSAAANAAPPVRALDGCQQPQSQPEGSAGPQPASRLHQRGASGQRQRQPGGAGIAAALGQLCVRSALSCLAPRSWLGPSRRVLPRHLVFYCASFSRKPGLPKRHLLARLQQDVHAARRLYAAITQPAPLGMGRQRAQQLRPKPQGASEPLPAIPSRIPAKHRPFLNALQHILDQSKRCPYGLLLQHHCPLPPCFRPSKAASRPTAQELAVQPALQQKSSAGDSLQAGSMSTQAALGGPWREPAEAGQHPGLGKQGGAGSGSPSLAAAGSLSTHAALCGPLPVSAVAGQCLDLEELAGAGSGGPSLAAAGLAAGSTASGSQGEEPLWVGTQDPMIIADSEDEADAMPEAMAGQQQMDRGAAVQPQRDKPAAGPAGQQPGRVATAHPQKGGAGATIARQASPRQALAALPSMPARQEEQQPSQGQYTQDIVIQDSEGDETAEGPLPTGQHRQQQHSLSLLGRCAQARAEQGGWAPVAGQQEPAAALHQAERGGGLQDGGSQLESAAGGRPGRALPVSQDDDPEDLPGLGRASRPAAGGSTEFSAPPAGGQDLQQQLLQASCSCQQVTAFVWAVVRRLVPQALLGDLHSQHALRAAIERMVTLRRHEHLTVHQVVQHIRLTTIMALWPPSSQGPGTVRCALPSKHAAQQRLLVLWAQWLLGQLVLPLIRAHFYCTESEAYKCKVFYFRKPVWAKLRHFAQQELAAQLYEPISMEHARQVLQQRRLGVARLRLVPKKTGMRPIVSLGSDSIAIFKGPHQRHQQGGRKRGRHQAVKLCFKSVNFELHTVLQVLKFEVSRQPHVLGGSVLSFNDVYMKLHPFIRQWRAAQATGSRASGDCQQAAAGCGPQAAAGVNPQGAAVLGRQAAARGGLQTASGCPSGLLTAGLLGSHVAAAAGSEQAGKAAHAAARDACWQGCDSRTGQVRAATGQAQQAAQVHPDVARGCPQHSAGARPADYSGPTRGHQSAHRQGTPASNHSVQPYIVSVDITRAFDNIDVSKLMQLVEPLFQCERYLLVKYQEVVPALGSVRVRTTGVAEDASVRFHGFPSLVNGLATSHGHRIFVDQVVYATVERSAVLSLLREHLQQNLVRIGRRWHRQKQGIPQGSTLSSLLCCIYLAHLETEHLLPLLPQAAWHSSCTSAASSVAPRVTDLALAAGSPSGTCAQARTPAGSSQQHQGMSPPSSGSNGAAQHKAKSRLRFTCSQQAQEQGLAAHHVRKHPAMMVPPTGSTDPMWAGAAAAERSAAAAARLTGADAGGQAAAGPLAGAAAEWPAAAAASLAGAAGSRCAAAGVPVGAAGGRQAAARAPQLQSLLIRLIDDFLFVTPSLAAAQALVQRLLSGFSGDSISINPSKTRLSFFMQTPDGLCLPATTFRDGAGRSFMKWCGLLVNCQTLELQADYTRYMGTRLADSMALPLNQPPGQQLPAKLCHYLRPKCHPLLLDATINSSSTVRLNIFQLCLLAAMKFHCYIRELPCGSKNSQQLCWDAIANACNYLSALIKGRLAAARSRLGVTGCTAVSRCHVTWLYLKAFEAVLSRKQSAFPQLLAQIKLELADVKYALLPRQLATAVDPARSDMFASILF